MQHLRSLHDLSADDIRDILTLSGEIKSEVKNGKRSDRLAGRVLSLVFEKPSLRTRVSFEAGMTQLGGRGIFLSAKEAGLNGRESLADVARVLSSYSDAIALRTFSQTLIEEFADWSKCPVINALSDDRHPCQALTDLLTIQESFGTLDGVRIVYVGDGNNIAASLAIATSMLGMPMTFASPADYELDPAFLNHLRDQHPKADLTVTNDVAEAVKTASVVYTDVWASMGQEEESKARQEVFRPFQVNQQLMALAPSDAKFMHDLPAHRGEEVTDEVIDGPQSLAFTQAENRMHLAKGLLVWLLTKADQK
ncbi:ornithine carbamoyltransferase [Thalassoroseus pseudoceratinae]|uniref:ornithine carbamoyltransferase n=1 Tax=Thalassoroseus pseudoceratinae TaxID=2713176 RepID=UPI00141DB574|nr:ornithine carbamoyltransferase [Thalassoroseus pseudoceratinae]